MPQLTSLAAGDLNGDGRADVAGSGLHALPDPLPTLNTLYVLEAGEDGLGQPSVLASDFGYASIALADLDGDGRAEVLAGNNAANMLQAAPNLSAPHPWRNHAHALSGVHGEPTLTAIGWAQPGTPGALRLFGAAPSAPAVLFVSPVSTPTPFKGGLLFPVPPALSTPLVTDALGRIELGWSSWPALGSGSVYWLQAAVADAAGPKGASLSNALQLLQP